MTDTKPQTQSALESRYPSDESRGGIQHPSSAPAPRGQRDDDDDDYPRKIVLVNQTPLNHDQVQRSKQLRRLYQSLAGDRPGEYAPQALLDTAGRLNRPNFPPAHTSDSGRNKR